MFTPHLGKNGTALVSFFLYRCHDELEGQPVCWCRAPRKSGDFVSLQALCQARTGADFAQCTRTLPCAAPCETPAVQPCCRRPKTEVRGLSHCCCSRLQSCSGILESKGTTTSPRTHREEKPVCWCLAPRDGQEFSGRTLYALAHASLSPRPRLRLLARRAHIACPRRSSTTCASRPHPRPSKLALDMTSRAHRTPARAAKLVWHRTTKMRASHAGIENDHPTRAAAGYGFGSTSARTPASATPR